MNRLCVEGFWTLGEPKWTTMRVRLSEGGSMGRAGQWSDRGLGTKLENERQHQRGKQEAGPGTSIESCVRGKLYIVVPRLGCGARGGCES